MWMLPNNIDATPDHTPFTNEVGVQIAALPPGAIATMGDVTGDHYADLLYVNSGSLYYLPNNILSNANHLPFTGAAGRKISNGGFATATALVAADVSGDGYADLLWADNGTKINYIPNNLNATGSLFNTPSTQVAALGTDGKLS
jgi:hypothetical protein